MITIDPIAALAALESMGGFLLYYPPASDGPAKWEHTIDEGYIRDLHKSSGSEDHWDHWAFMITGAAEQAAYDRVYPSH